MISKSAKDWIYYRGVRNIKITGSISLYEHHNNAFEMGFSLDDQVYRFVRTSDSEVSDVRTPKSPNSVDSQLTSRV